MVAFRNKSLVNICVGGVISALAPTGLWAAPAACEVRSGERLTPVIELYTSEGCSSCPPADQWLSTLKGKPVVAQAFHVAYWDYIGWKDPFANASHTARQKELAVANGLSGIYTPQVVRDGRDWRAWRNPYLDIDTKASPKAAISVRKAEAADTFEASVTPASSTQKWTAYWTVTEHNHSSHVRAGENAGEFLKHDFLVVQYEPQGIFQGTQALNFRAMASHPDHPRQINLVVLDTQTGTTLQAVSLTCS